jgi:hypothetical protein
MAKEVSKSIIRIYPSFTEIRQNVNAVSPYQIYFPQDLYDQIAPGSINLEGVNVRAMNTILRENDLEGKIVHINKDKETRKVKMIRSRDSLVQDLETLRYYNVDMRNIEFSDVPEETGTEATFKIENDGPAVLSYLMFGIKWTPRYQLNITGDSNVFQGWADIKNNTQTEYLIEKTELLGGDISIRQNRQNHYSMERCNMTMDVMACRAAPSIQAEGEVAGLYMYSIASGYHLNAQSTFSLPFVAPHIELKKVALIDSHFSNSNTRGQSSRVYKIKSNEYLPNGSVTVREDGRVVGQSSIPDLSAESNADLNVGNDGDVSYDREVITLSHDENQSEYTVSVTITNRKDRHVNIEFYERFYGRFEAESDSAGAFIQNDFLKCERSIDSKSQISIKYSVKFYYDN